MCIIVVSGLPRSGTSLMMQMLQAGGLNILVDDQRPPDNNNPRGYFEYEPVNALKWENYWIPQAEGKAVKVIPVLLPYLPHHFRYKIILMKRDLDEVVASQGAVLQRQGRQGSAAGHATLKRIFARHLDEIERWLADQAHLEVTTVNFRRTVTDPENTARTVARFLGLPLDEDKMTAVVDPNLYRQRNPDSAEGKDPSP